MFDILPGTLQYWYKNFLSNYLSDIDSKKWPHEKIERVDKSTGEIIEKPVYIFRKEHLGERMSIDDKSIGHDGFTIFSNHATGKIALLVESTHATEVERAMELFGKELYKVKNISMDMSPTYALVSDNLMPRTMQIVDKFHVMKYVYEAVGDVRLKIKKELTASLTQGKKKTQEDKQKLSDLELVRRVQHAVTQSPDKWNTEMNETINQVFEKYDELKTAYQISQNFKKWYDYKNRFRPTFEITKGLCQWYEQARELKEFESVKKMIRKHEDEIINFSHYGITNAKTERLNGKIQRFVSNNYGIKDRDFIRYRIANYFSWHLKLFLNRKHCNSTKQIKKKKT
jgi:transposase